MLSIVSPLALIVIWALVVAPGADIPLGPTSRMLLGSLLLLLTAAALATTGHRQPATILSALTVLNTVLLLSLRA